MQKEHKLLYYFKKWTTISIDDETTILSSFEQVSIKKKNELLKPDTLCKYLYFVIEGCIRSYHIDSKGVEHIFQIRMDNSWIGDLESFISHTPSKYYIETLEDTTLLRISEERFEKLMKDVPALERYFRILFQKAYINTLNRLNANMWEPAINRYRAMLKEHPEMFQRVPLIYIASYLGITPESLSRIRKQN